MSEMGDNYENFDELRIRQLLGEALSMRGEEVEIVDFSPNFFLLLSYAVEALAERETFTDDTHLMTIYDEIERGVYSDEEILEMTNEGTFTPDIVQMNPEISEMLMNLRDSLRHQAMLAFRRESKVIKRTFQKLDEMWGEEAKNALPSLMDDIYKMLGKEKP